ncbi:ribonuclease D [Entomobacter blattae]|nr:ribonuclease D [Entomobacter blattae]
MSPKISNHDFPAPKLITTSAELREVLLKLNQEEFVTIDTEFIREHHYWPQLCLLQLAGEHDVILIDALSIQLDLSLMKDFLKNPEITKVFHAAGQDLEIFYKLFGFLPATLFDTQIAAMVAGFGEQIGYDNLVMSLLGVSISKKYRFSDWAVRPLSLEQIGYAAADVTYLRLVYKKLKEILIKERRIDWIQTEMEQLSRPEKFLADPAKMWEKIRIKTRDRKVLTVLQALAGWREQEAQRQDVPRQKVIKDDSLVEVAQMQPQTVEKLEKIRGIPKDLAFGSTGKAIIEVIATAISLPSELQVKLPERKDQPKSMVNLFSLLKVLLAHRCEEFRVAPRLVATTEDLEQLVNYGEKANTPVLQGWRKTVFGEEALALCQGKLALTANQKHVEVVKAEF